MNDLENSKSTVGSLSDRQRDCLRLVGRGLTSKEIAIETGLAPQTVDTYLKSAMARLNAPTRRDAARIMLAHESISQKLGSPSVAIARGNPTTHLGGAARREKLLRTLALPPVGGTINELSAAQRTYAVLRVAGASVIIISALVLVIAGVMMTFL